MSVRADRRPLLHAPGSRTDWRPVLDRVERHGFAVVHGLLERWLPDGPGAGGESAVRALLGRDWERYRSIGHPAARRRFLASRAFLKHACAHVLGVRPESLDLARLPGGAPCLRGCEGLRVSLSHTGGVALVGLSTRGRIGVDVEPARRRIAGTGLEAEMCAAGEREALAALPPAARNAELVRLWTLKEAFTKAIGQGLRFPFTELAFSPPAAGGARERLRVLAPDGSPGTGPEWDFVSTCLPDGRHVAGVACEEGAPGTAGTGLFPDSWDEEVLHVLRTRGHGRTAEGAP
ncbi:4-phosphopantetheinyl transferase [Streptomyces armeniacus]|uniref:4-phosphopantetheinyl transferase n=1 Tax=Streptomyces armeniacus TaxID=83291 RepID=A0A345XUY3_9ACTN|nr:4'-phosphopantetheinyl transferase superfamily protein [Streptomyces armeniacus]AWS21294.1 4'-phosphopantetheinyl transferase [Streptomyces armeniacus]AXK35449.1 4-phosphopantetheinyl transferase [Streptomyces armeniacus]AZY92012.1 putative 4'-phosphopantetheinyl transferase [Streptomyces armeniacus]